MSNFESIDGLTKLCLKWRIHFVPVRDRTERKILELFFPKEKFEELHSELRDAAGDVYSIRPLSPASTENIAIYQAFQKLTDEFGADAVQRRIADYLKKIWPDFAAEYWMVLGARLSTKPIPQSPNVTAASSTSSTTWSTSSEPPTKVGVLWCTWFAGSWWTRPWRLKYAYRPPSLFASKMRAAGYGIQFLVCDEKLELAHLDGSNSFLQDEVEILYVMTHGEFDKAQGYHAELNANKWRPSSKGLGVSANSRLSVVVFDTCNLIDSSLSWQSNWAQNLGPSVRLILGFEGSVAIDQGSAHRGHAFATELIDNRLPFAEAWLIAAQSAMVNLDDSYKQAVAIGVGNSVADAKAILQSASLANMPTKRTGSSMFFELKR